MRRLLLGALAFAAFACASAVPEDAGAQASGPIAGEAREASVLPRLDCTDAASQGGAIICRTEPGASLSLGGKVVARADGSGLAVIGLPIDQPTPAVIRLESAGSLPIPFDPSILTRSVPVATRQDPVSRFEMECGKIAPQTPAQKRHAELSWEKKARALEVFHEPVAPVGFAKPADGPYSSPFGAVRTYVPKTRDCEGRTSVHNGLDIAVGTGSAVVAPMGGTVILADPDLFYEGGCVFLDHGRGLVSVFMHLSRIDVKPGDVLGQGEAIGLSGATGRVTGPHLHWAIKYRNAATADRATDIWLDPALLLKLGQ